MRAVVLVDHGSRSAEANAQLEEVAAQVRARLPERTVVAAHMELAAPDLPTAIDDCVSGGAREIVVAPWFLSPGRHGATDIPRMVDEARGRHPEVQLSVAGPLGVHPGLIDAVLERISEGEDPKRRG
jgi:sirohydrochlorin ferrochelatase